MKLIIRPTCNKIKDIQTETAVERGNHVTAALNSSCNNFAIPGDVLSMHIPCITHRHYPSTGLGLGRALGLGYVYTVMVTWDILYRPMPLQGYILGVLRVW